ncbi:hypothetical protein [Mesorhizobium sp. M0323]|uniref:hypothetical protein n=1 Tax=Mesorhizobium sp. M0323 TaxID=2956938 RepID=UPI0033354733
MMLRSNSLALASLLLSIETAASRDCSVLQIGCRVQDTTYGLGIDTSFPPRAARIAPYVGTASDIDRNARAISKAMEESPFTTSLQWLVKVSGGRFRDSRGAGSHEWDYSVHLRATREYPSDGIDPGSYNFMVTGQIVVDSKLQDLGISDTWTRDHISYFVLTAGSALYQFQSDLAGENHHLAGVRNSVLGEQWLDHPLGSLSVFWQALRKDRTWYGEDTEDVPALEMGYQHAKLLQLERTAESVGIDFHPSDLGYREEPPRSPYHFLNENDYLPFMPSYEDKSSNGMDSIDPLLSDENTSD